MSYVAKHMHAEECSVARLLSFFAEAVGEEVADGRVFRFPGFFIVGPCLTGRRSADHIVPRFHPRRARRQNALYVPWSDAPLLRNARPLQIERPPGAA